VNLTEWARVYDVHPQTAYRWFRHLARLSGWAQRAGMPVVRVETEVGSGMNGVQTDVGLSGR
jgi:predicted site-specific integrase-resolvase